MSQTLPEFKGTNTEEHYEKRALSRRTFLGGAALGAAGIALSGLGGCAPSAEGSADNANAANEADSALPEGLIDPASPTASFTPEWLTAPPELADADETIEVDFLVIGAGVAGIAASLAARMKNPDLAVTVIEKTDSFTVRGLVFGAVNSQFQLDLGCVLDKEAIFLDWMQFSGNRANPLLVRKWIEESGPCHDWFAEVTSEENVLTPRLEHWPQPEAFDNTTEWYRQYNTGIEYTDATGADLWAGDSGVIAEFYNKSVREGVDYQFNTEAKQLALASDGTVEGAFAEQDGKIIKFVASKGTLLSTGDYGANTDMLQALCPEFYYALGNATTRIETSTGDGHKMAVWAGGVMEPAPHAHMSHSFAGGFAGLGATAALQLNLFGKRWCNEDVPGQSFTNGLLRQPTKTSYQIWDSGHTIASLSHQNIGHGNREMQLQTAETLAAMQEGWNASLEEGYEGALIGAQTLEELFEKMGLPVETALAEVNRYNELCAQGHDDDFYKRADRMIPVSEGPFFASKAFIAAGVTTAGIIVDGDLQVIDVNGDPLGRLWAAGNVAGGRYAIDYPTFCPATSHGTAITFGKSVGEQVAVL